MQDNIEGRPPAPDELQRLIDFSPAVHYISEPSGDYAAIFLSSGVKEQTGYDAAQFLSSPDFWLSKVHPEDRQGVLQSLKQGFATNDRHTQEYRFLHADGSWRWMHDEMRMIRDADGRPLEIIGSWLDITERKAAEEKLRANDARTRLLLAAVPDLIFRMDAEGRYLDYYASDPAQLALSPDVFVGRRLDELFDPDFAATNQRCIDRALSSKELQLNDYRLSIRGEEREFEARFVPVADSEVVVITRDVTEARRAARALEEREQELRAILESGPDALIIVGTEGTIQQANAEAERLFAYGHGELAGLRIEQLIPERRRVGNMLRRMSHADSSRREHVPGGWDLSGLTKQGKEVPVEVRLSPIRAGNGLLIVASLRNVSRRLNAETRLREAKAAAEKANAAKSRFLATASHDLRQPLQSLALLNSVLEKTVTDPKALGVLKMQRDALASVSNLLNSLLDISKLDSGNVRAKMENVGLPELFERLRSEFAEQASAKQLQLIIDGGGYVAWTDEALIMQLLENLLGNAIRYTRTGTIRLHCRPAENGLELAVEDSGIGMAPEQLDAIFEEFYQIDPRAGLGGLGLGLSIVKRIAELLDTRVAVESQPGRGSRFSFVIPSGDPDALTSETPPQALRPPPGRSVLLIDNEPDVLDALRMLLEIEGFRVVAAASPGEAYAALERERQRPDVIVTDYQLSPEETGLDVIKKTRERLQHRIPAILVTGDTTLDASTIDLQEFRVLSKPMETAELLTAMHTFLDVAPARLDQ